MKRTGIFLIVIWVIFSGITHSSQNTKKTEDIIPVKVLFENPSMYDEKEVTIKGEVIGDIMREGEDFWINIKDENMFIGVIINLSQKEKIRYTGRYKIKGDIVKISGIYHLHCPVHSGERDIHTEQLEIIDRGYEVPEVIQSNRIIVSIIFGVITILILLYSHQKNIHKDTFGQQK